ncbi:MurR/RpiR family transcriptional regulator [Clostridium sp. AM58-1XD]|nr:MurR/RpiR family transcriptional regulator [Clostridium sp. AM58-1XD]
MSEPLYDRSHRHSAQHQRPVHHAGCQALSRAERVYIYSSGGSGATATYVYQLFLQIGIPCNYFIDRQLGLMSIEHLKENDVAVGINFSGNSATVTEMITLAKQKRATTIAITSGTHHPLSKLAEIPLCYSTKISDDLRQIHAARMCELAIIGQLQTAYINITAEKSRNSLQRSKLAIKKSRI